MIEWRRSGILDLHACKQICACNFPISKSIWKLAKQPQSYLGEEKDFLKQPPNSLPYLLIPLIPKCKESGVALNYLHVTSFPFFLKFYAKKVMTAFAGNLSITVVMCELFLTSFVCSAPKQ